MARGVNHYFKDGRKHAGGTHRMPNGDIHSGKTHGKTSEQVFHYGELSKLAKAKARQGWRK